MAIADGIAYEQPGFFFIEFRKLVEGLEVEQRRVDVFAWRHRHGHAHNHCRRKDRAQAPSREFHNAIMRNNGKKLRRFRALNFHFFRTIT